MSEMTPEPHRIGIGTEAWSCRVHELEVERDDLRERVARLESQAAIQAKLIQSVHSDLMMGFTEEALESMERFHDPYEAGVHAHWDEDRRLRRAMEEKGGE